MHLILSSCLICIASSVVISSGSFVTQSSELGHVTVMSASGEGLQSAVGAESDSNASGVPVDLTVLPGQSSRKPESHPRSARRKQGGKKRPRTKVNLGQTAAHTHTHTHSPTSNPCLSSHRDYCINGHCTYLQDLEEPVCVCMKGFDGVRCGVHVLQTGSGPGGVDESSTTDSLHMTLIITTVVLSVISCSAILLMICVQYRTQHSFQTAFFNPAMRPLKSPVV